MSYRLKQSWSVLEEALPAHPTVYLSHGGGERAVYVSRMVLQIPVWLVKSVSATETNSCSGYRLVGWMI